MNGPRDSEEHILINTFPLDLKSLLAEINSRDEINNAKAFPTGAKIGHMHLRVTNLERSIKFYHQKIGLDITLDWRSDGCRIPFYRWISSSHWIIHRIV